MVIVGYWALLRRQAELDGMPAINAKRIYRLMRQNALLLERNLLYRHRKRAHTGRVAVKESNQRWCSTGSSSAVITEKNCESRSALDCCDRKALHWAVQTTAASTANSTGRHAGAVERRFDDLPCSFQWSG